MMVCCVDRFFLLYTFSLVITFSWRCFVTSSATSKENRMGKKARKTPRKKQFARDGDRTHAHYCELDLKSNALTTRPPWHILLHCKSSIQCQTKKFFVSKRTILYNIVHGLRGLLPLSQTIFFPFFDFHFQRCIRVYSIRAVKIRTLPSGIVREKAYFRRSVPQNKIHVFRGIYMTIRCEIQ